jgi:hypothetical protein
MSGMPCSRGSHMRDLAALLLVAGSGGCYWAAGTLAAPAPREVGELPGDLPGRSVRLLSPGAGTLRGWVVPGRRGAGGAVLAFLRRQVPGERVGVIGVSLGGASVLPGPQPLGVGALVLEAVYPTLAEALDDRLARRFGPLGPSLAPLLAGPLRPHLGVDVDELRPIDGIDRVEAPVLVIAGTTDRPTTWAESPRLFARAVPQPQTRARVGFPSPRPRGNICSRLAAWSEPRFDRQVGGRGWAPWRAGSAGS